MNTNIYGKFYFIECDEIITRALAPFMQFCSLSTTSLIDKICIDSSTKIDNHTSYRCLKSDVGVINKARFEARKYSLIYPHLNISFNTKLPESMTEDYILKRFGVIKSTWRYNKDNFFLITCSSTPKRLVEDIKNIVQTSKSNNYTHIHCELGNLNDGGMIYCSNGISNSEHAVNYPKSIPNLQKGDIKSPKMLVQSVMGANILFSILINILSFKTLRHLPVFFNYSKMDIDVSPHAPKLMEPIQLLEPKKSNEENLVDDHFYVLMIGAGAVSNNSLDAILQLANLHPENIEKFVLMDGDVIEPKNRRNQRFLVSEVGDFKVIPLVKRFSNAFKNLEIKLKAIPEYLYKFDEEFLLKAFDLDSIEDKNIIILGGVDNIPTRREIHLGFSNINKVRNFVYIDSGNGSTERIGQTITGYKQYGKVILEPIASSGVDNGAILNNTEDIHVIGSCSRNIQENPQDLSTSIAASCSLIANFANVFIDRTIRNHMSFFDAENIFMNSY